MKQIENLTKEECVEIAQIVKPDIKWVYGQYQEDFLSHDIFEGNEWKGNDNIWAFQIFTNVDKIDDNNQSFFMIIQDIKARFILYKPGYNEVEIPKEVLNKISNYFSPPKEESEKTCPECKIAATEAEKFCAECGFPFEKQIGADSQEDLSEANQKESGKTCPECNTTTAEAEKFCSGCGFPFEKQIGADSKEALLEATQNTPAINISNKTNIFKGTQPDLSNASFPDWDITPPGQIINPRIKKDK